MNSIDNDENLSEEGIEEEIEEETGEDEINEDEIESKETEELKTQNDLLKQELSDLNNKYLRLAAEYKNYQERSKKRKVKYQELFFNRSCFGDFADNRRYRADFAVFFKSRRRIRKGA